MPGIYQFIRDNDSYICSTSNLFTRCFTQHKNNAFSKTSKHKKFYTDVIKNSWNVFKLIILNITPNHIEFFAKLNINHILTKEEYKSLFLFNFMN